MLTLGCDAAKKTKQDKTKPNNPQISIQNIYIYIPKILRSKDITLPMHAT